MPPLASPWFLWLLLVLFVWPAKSTAQRFPTAASSDDAAGNDVSQGMDAIRQGALSLHSCGLRQNTLLKRVMLTNRTIVCNDGSPAGYYIRRSHGSRRWIIYLEGGWYCFDVKSCHSRWTRMRALMTSQLWPEYKQVGGILSSDPEENAHWWNANHVFIPYCSSDSWSGSSFPKSKDHLAFLGSEIVLQVVRDLAPQGLDKSKKLYLAGSSAGGTGVIMNLDRVADMVRGWGWSLDVRGLADSGWFLDNEPYLPLDCTDAHACAPVEAVKLGIKFWNGQVPERCRAQYGPSDLWKCYFGYRVYPTMRAPLFVFQWLFDEAQMTADNVGAPVSKAQWDYIHRMGDMLRTTLRNVTAVFAPSCISHIVLTKRDWQNVRINDVSLPQAIRCWEEHDHRLRTARREVNSDLNRSSELSMQADTPNASRKREHRRFHNRPLGRVAPPIVILTTNSSTTATTRGGRKRKNKKRNRRKKHKERRGRKNRTQRSSEAPSRLQHNACNLRHLDECSWPQCNRACPKLHNPFTGEEMDFIELLKSFGLDMGSVATALGLDLDTLQSMGNDHLLQILTQSTSK